MRKSMKAEELRFAQRRKGGKLRGSGGNGRWESQDMLPQGYVLVKIILSAFDSEGWERMSREERFLASLEMTGLGVER